MEVKNQAERWKELVAQLSEKFGQGEELDLDAIIFLIGIQELGQGPGRFRKDAKIDLMHIAICRLLEPFGYYEFVGRDKDGWPHYELLESLPELKAGEQSVLMKQAILRYFEERD